MPNIDTMSKYPYILEPYKGIGTRYECPNCGKRKTFARYIDTVTNQHIASIVGKCNRLINCGYHLTPKQFFLENRQLLPIEVKNKSPLRSSIKHSLIPENYFLESLKKYEQNNFVKFLVQQFGDEVSSQLISKYFIGSSKHWDGATVFWQIDINKKIRTGKIMLYDAIAGKRIKEPYSLISWVHKILAIADFTLQQCLFGEHLLNNDSTSPIAIVESEKTAIIASHFLPEFIWLACGGINGLSIEKCAVLKGRNILIYPDVNCYSLWEKKAELLSEIAVCSISKLLETHANDLEKKLGVDIADYLILNQQNNDY